MKKIFALVLLLPMLLVTGCPSNEYVVDLTPHGKIIERKLEFYCEDGVNSNGIPNYANFDPAELARITQLYPPKGLITDSLRHVYTVTGEFGARLPDDVRGRGSYTNVTTSLGSAGFYLERFRGDDDLATRTAKRLKAADQVTDLVIGWSRMELGRERGYEHLRHFLDTDFRRDVKNMSLYAWMLQTSSAIHSPAKEEFAVRFGQYLAERGYLQLEDLPDLFHAMADKDTRPLMKRIQRLVASKLGVPQYAPIPPSLAFLSDWDLMNQSWEKYLVTTDLYEAKLRHWQKEKIVHGITVAEHRARGLYDPAYRTNPVPAAPGKPAPSEVLDQMGEGFLDGDIFGIGTDDHVIVRLSLPSAPTHSNGKWDDARKQVVWESNLEQSKDDGRVPAFCYANWSEPDEAAQKQRFGRVLLSGDDLCAYCLWRSALGKKEAAEWDALLASLQPGDDFKAKLQAFRFSSDPVLHAKKGQAEETALSDFPKSLLGGALDKASAKQ